MNRCSLARASMSSAGCCWCCFWVEVRPTALVEPGPFLSPSSSLKCGHGCGAAPPEGGQQVDAGQEGWREGERGRGHNQCGGKYK